MKQKFKRNLIVLILHGKGRQIMHSVDIYKDSHNYRNRLNCNFNCNVKVIYNEKHKLSVNYQLIDLYPNRQSTDYCYIAKFNRHKFVCIAMSIKNAF